MAHRRLSSLGIGDVSARERRHLLVGIGFVTAVKVAVVLGAHHHHPGGAFVNDSASYLSPARALIEDHAFLSAPGSGEAEFLRTPGYPLFLATTLWSGGQRIGFVLLVQALVAVATVALTYCLGRRVGLTHGFAMGAGLLLALDPYHLTVAAVIQTESLAALCTVVLALAAVAAVEHPDRAARWLAFAASITVATFVRPTTFYSPLVVVVGVTAGLVRTRVPWRRVVPGAAAFALGVLPLGLYSVRNQVEFGSFTFSSAEPIVNYWYRAGWNVSETDHQPWDPDVRVELTKRLVPELTDAEAMEYRSGGEVPPQWTGSVGDYYDEANRRAWGILLDDPLLSTRQFVRGLRSQFVGTGWLTAARVAGLSPVPAPVDWTSRIWVVLVNVSAVVGVGATAMDRRRRTGALAPAILASYFLVVSAGAQAVDGARMRAPITPILSVYALVTVSAVWGSYRRRKA